MHPDEEKGGSVTTTRGYAHRVDIAAPRSRVWTALTEARLLARWCGTRAEVQPRTGGRFDVTVGVDLPRQAMIDAFEPGRRLRLVFLVPPGLPVFDGAVVEEYLLEAEGPGTLLRLLGSGFPSGEVWDEHYVAAALQTERALLRLKVLLERKVAPPVVPGIGRLT
jgi:uncharacterized protein YndB with AHSA1/START domain